MGSLQRERVGGELQNNMYLYTIWLPETVEEIKHDR
jgi:hypothetical protein